MAKIHKFQRMRSVSLYALYTGSLRVLLKKSFIALAVFMTVFASAVAEPTEYSVFPTMSGDDYMKENSVYKDAAVASNMLGVTSGTIFAKPVYITYSCPVNQYLSDKDTCIECPGAYPESDGKSGGITSCYKTVTRECTQNSCSCPDNSSCVCNECGCAGETYIQYAASDGVSGGVISGATTSEICNQTVDSATCNAGYYMKNANVCDACPKGTYKAASGNNMSDCIAADEGYYVDTIGATTQVQCPLGYRSGSNNGRDDITDCYKECPAKNVEHALSVIPVRTIIPYEGDTSASDAVCAYDVICEEGYDATANGTENPSCVSVVVNCPAGEYLPDGSRVCSTCPENSYCVDNTLNSCEDGLVSPQGTTSAGACGKKMYVDNEVLYLTKEKQTVPALAVKVDGIVYYGKLTPVSDGVKPMNGTTNKSLRTKIDGVEYSIHDNTVQEE